MTDSGAASGNGPAGRSHTDLDEFRITAIETTPVVAPLATVFRGSHYEMSRRATLITQVHTASGVTGVAYAGDEDDGLTDIEAIVHKEIEPRLIGMNALATELCWERSYAVTFDILRDRRLGLVALAGVDTALWDIVGKVAGLPLWQLWGGYRDEIPLIAIGGYYGEPLGSIEEEIACYREMGLAGVKFKVGGADPSSDADRLKRARSAAGEDFLIAMDANQGFTTAEALDLASRVEELDIAWFEEPVRWHNDRRSLRDVRLRSNIRVCAGQSEYSASGCRDLMESGAIDICNFDASWSGGPTAWRRAAATAHGYDVLMGHHEEPQVASHLIASQPHGTVAECFHPDRDPFWWNLIANTPSIIEGRIRLPSDPGLGWKINWDYAEKYRVPR